MRITAAIMIILLTSIGWAQNKEVDFSCKDLSHIVEAEQHHFGQKNQFRANPLTADYDIRYHRMAWSVDPSENYITGSVTTHFMPKAEGFNVINFDLEDNMQVNAVTYRGDSLSHAFTSPVNLQIMLPAVIEVNQLDSLTIEYEGAPIATGFGSFRQGEHDGVPVIWTLSEPYGARTWWPCKQDLSDKIDSIDIIVRTPAENRVASNGLLINEALDGGEKLFHWRHRYPIPAYLIAIGVTNYEVFSDHVRLSNGDSLEILNYIYPEDRKKAEEDLESTVAIMTFFDSLFGDYPFAEEKYGHAQFGFSGGMEHQTMSFMGKFTHDLQAHELAHQWFGNKVTCGSWQDIWLNEGFATYLTGLTKEFLGAEEEFYNWKRDRVNHITANTAGSVWVEDTSSVLRIFSGRLSYSKGAMLLHMLRWVMGDEDFFTAIRNYIGAPELAFGYARTEDLQYYLESQSDMDLSGFFANWLYGQGYPSYHLTWTMKDNSVTMTLNQATSHPSVAFYNMPVPVYLSGEGQDTIVRLEHTYDGQEFDLEVPFIVDSVVVDPDYWLVSANNTVENLPVSTTDVDKIAQLFKVIPNPFPNELTIGSADPSFVISNIDVYHSSGALIWAKDVERLPLRIDASDWLPGIYFLRITTSGGEIFSRKVIKVE